MHNDKKAPLPSLLEQRSLFVIIYGDSRSEMERSGIELAWLD
jgi:hypothetical protein